MVGSLEYAFSWSSKRIIDLFCCIIFVPANDISQCRGRVSRPAGTIQQQQYMYMNWHEKNAQQAKTMAEPTKSQFVQKQGGVDSTALTIAIVVMVFLSIVVSAVAAA